MREILQIALSLSVLCNLFTIWQLFKAFRSLEEHVMSLSKLVMLIAEAHPDFHVIKGNVIPFNLKK